MLVGEKSLSPKHKRLINLVMRKLGVDDKDPVEYNLALGYIMPYIYSDKSATSIEKLLRPLWPLYQKSLESIRLSLD